VGKQEKNKKDNLSFNNIIPLDSTFTDRHWNTLYCTVIVEIILSNTMFSNVFSYIMFSEKYVWPHFSDKMFLDSCVNFLRIIFQHAPNTQHIEYSKISILVTFCYCVFIST
jgi:hypothetical protein